MNSKEREREQSRAEQTQVREGDSLVHVTMIWSVKVGCYLPAHDPYFLRFILDIPRGARKKAQKSPARAFRTLNVNQDSHRTPTTATTFL